MLTFLKYLFFNVYKYLLKDYVRNDLRLKRFNNTFYVPGNRITMYLKGKIKIVYLNSEKDIVRRENSSFGMFICRLEIPRLC